jgi:tetratricopeptide (TPR) repeat protein
VYDLLEAGRDAAQALSAAGRDSDHAHLVLACVRALNREPAAYVHQRWLHEFDAAHESIAAAISWAIEHGRPDTACALVVEVAHYWDHRQLLDTARATLSMVVSADPTPSSKRSEALTWLAFFSSEQGDVDEALGHLETAVADATAAGDPAREAGAGAIASVVLRDLDPTAAESRASTAVDLFLAHGDRREIAYGWTTHALAALAAGAPRVAADSAHAAAAIYAELGDRRGLAWTKSTQSRIAATLGLDAEAATLRDEARTVALHIEDVRTARHLEQAEQA